MAVDDLAAQDEQQKLDLEGIEIRLLTEGIFQHYGFDFRDYSLPSLKLFMPRRCPEGYGFFTMYWY